jgi:cytochrome P450
VPLPDGPRESAYLQVLRYSRDPAAYYSAMHKRYGDCFTLKFAGQPPYVVVASPEGVRDVLDAPPDELRAGEAASILEFLVGRNSLLLLDGARHARERKRMMPPLHGERMVAYGERIGTLALDAIARWPLGAPFAAHAAMQEISLEIVLQCVFGVAPGADQERWKRLVVRFLDGVMTPQWLILGSVLPGTPLRRALVERLAPLSDRLPAPLGRRLPGAPLARTLRELDARIEAHLAHLRAAPAGAIDIMSLLMAARADDGSALSDAELHDQMITLLIAGHETTATTLTWALWEILRRPDVQAELRRELDAVFGDGPIDAARLRELAYLDGAIRETLRLYPIGAGFGRKLARPTRIAGHDLPAGIVVMPSMYLLHRRAAEWPAPERFDPTRFLGRKPKANEYFPFGGGVRTCAGMAFALFEMKLLLAHFVRHARLALAPAPPPRLSVRGFLFGPSHRVPVTLAARRLDRPL